MLKKFVIFFFLLNSTMHRLVRPLCNWKQIGKNFGAQMFMAFIDETEVLCLYCLHKKKEKKKENSFVGLWAGGEICG